MLPKDFEHLKTPMLQIDERGRCRAIEGRQQEFVVDCDGNGLPGLTIALDTSTWDFVRACQLHQRTPGKVTLRVAPTSPPLTVPQRHALLAGPTPHWGQTIEFDCIEYQEFPKSLGGKQCFVVNELLRPGSEDDDGPSMRAVSVHAGIRTEPDSQLDR